MRVVLLLLLLQVAVLSFLTPRVPTQSRIQQQSSPPITAWLVPPTKTSRLPDNHSHRTRLHLAASKEHNFVRRSLSRVGRILTYPVRKVVRLMRTPNQQHSVEVVNGATTATVVESEPQPAPAIAVPVEEVAPVTVVGDRRATAKVDLSGSWKLIVDDAFKTAYDQYLTLLGQPLLVRSVATNIVGLTTEETIQSDDGRSLEIRGINVRGVWERTLIASGADADQTVFEPILVNMTTADDEMVQAESWWEENGTVHRSWLRGVQKYGGGAFESRRYLDDHDRYVCESTFHPLDETREKAKVTWIFERQPQQQQ